MKEGVCARERCKELGKKRNKIDVFLFYSFLLFIRAKIQSFNEAITSFSSYDISSIRFDKSA